jgi:hypothetical protein
VQLALELVEAQHQVAECLDAAATQKAQLCEGKAQHEAKVLASLDAQLQAALAALDTSLRVAWDWQKGSSALMERYARLLHGQEPIPGERHSVCCKHVDQTDMANSCASILIRMSNGSR